VEDLALGARHLFDRAEAFEVRAGHVGHHADVGLADVGQVGDLAARPHGHFQNPKILLLGRFQHGHGQADVRVVVALGAQDRARHRKRGGDQLLGRGLAVGSRDADHAALEAQTHRMGQSAQRARTSPTAITGTPSHPAGMPARGTDHHGGGAGLGRGGAKIETIHALAGQARRRAALASPGGCRWPRR
jgi:hypothetical protein